ncbi:MAG TPA: hypothetical protein VFP05_02340 [Thermomicrobiales bacterium]|nr:hypothetical protein [Thermomicrobiales bacterium]
MGLRAPGLETLAEQELRPGERLLWWGFCLSQRGKQRKEGGPYAGFFLGGLLGFIMLVCTRIPALLVMIPILSLIGGIITIKRGPSSLYRKKRTIYAVTDQRVFALCDTQRDRWVTSIPYKFLTDVSVSRVQGDSRGIVSFTDVSSERQPSLRFVMVAGATRVKEVVERARSQAIE